MSGTFYQRRGKRALDVVGAAVGLVVTAPIQCAVAVVVRRSMGRPVLFRQTRPGLNGAPFTMYKFRTMTVASSAAVAAAGNDGDRLTAVGRRLRTTSLDELPELWNVLRGDMSLVGPRPLLVEYLTRYTPAQQRRHNVRPGLTGWAQVNGRNAVTWQEKFQYDTWYVDNYSLRVDLRILAKTVTSVLRRHGISESGQSTASEFMGET